MQLSQLKPDGFIMLIFVMPAASNLSLWLKKINIYICNISIYAKKQRSV